jgi:transcriptional regulator with XRE-family HTH domain
MDGREYPNDWARLIADLVKKEDGNQTQLARKLGVGRNTIGRWLSGSSINLTVDKIKLVATRAGISRGAAALAAVDAQEADAARDDQSIRDIEDSDFDDEYKQAMIDKIRRHRRDSENALRLDIEVMLKRPRDDEQAS